MKCLNSFLMIICAVVIAAFSSQAQTFDYRYEHPSQVQSGYNHTMISESVVGPIISNYSSEIKPDEFLLMHQYLPLHSSTIDGVIVKKMRIDGNVLWSQHFSVQGKTTFFSDIALNGLESYGYVVGNIIDGGHQHGIIIQFQPFNGVIVNSVTFGPSNGGELANMKIKPSGQGTMIVCGNINDFAGGSGKELFMMELDDNLNYIHDQRLFDYNYLPPLLNPLTQSADNTLFQDFFIENDNITFVGKRDNSEIRLVHQELGTYILPDVFNANMDNAIGYWYSEIFEGPMLADYDDVSNTFCIAANPYSQSFGFPEVLVSSLNTDFTINWTYEHGVPDIELLPIGRFDFQQSRINLGVNLNQYGSPIGVLGIDPGTGMSLDMHTFLNSSPFGPIGEGASNLYPTTYNTYCLGSEFNDHDVRLMDVDGSGYSIGLCPFDPQPIASVGQTYDTYYYKYGTSVFIGGVSQINVQSTILNGMLKDCSGNVLLTFKTTDIEAIDDATEELVVYPNPSSGLFTITNHAKGTVSIQVVDMQGKEVFLHQLQNEGVVEEQIDLSALPKGNYHLRWISEEGTVNKKLTVL